MGRLWLRGLRVVILWFEFLALEGEARHLTVEKLRLAVLSFERVLLEGVFLGDTRL